MFCLPGAVIKSSAVAIATTASQHTVKLIQHRTLSSSFLLLQPHFTPPLSLHQQQQDQVSPPLSVVDARPYSEIPKSKTFLGLNMQLLKDPTQMGKFIREQGNELGPIFRLTGVPGMPEMLCVLDTKDLEVVFRVGDNSYPRRLRNPERVEIRKELNQPLGIFLE